MSHESDAVAPLPPSSDSELWGTFLRDPRGGLGEIYDRYAGKVYGVALAILAQPQEAEDLTQEVFASLSDRRDYDPARGSLGAFLTTLTRSRAIDRLRGDMRQSRILGRMRIDLDGEENHWSALERISIMELSREVRDALERLPENQRRVLEMAYFRGMSQTEIAAEVGAPLGTVKSWTRMGLFDLRHALGHLLG